MLILPYIVQKVALPDRLPDTLLLIRFGVRCCCCWLLLLTPVAIANTFRIMSYKAYMAYTALESDHFGALAGWGSMFLDLQIHFY